MLTVHTHKARRAQLLYVVAALTLVASCSGDDSSSGSDAGSGGSGGASGAGSGANGGSSGDTGGSSGANGGSGAAGAGASGGDGGSSGGGTGGDGAADGGGELDSGTDSGVPGNEFACVAPTPSTDFGEQCPAEDPVTLALAPLRTDLDIPIFVTHAPDDESRLFVVQRGGQILILDPEDGATIGTFLDLSDRATTANSAGGEYGLLGLAFHPNYPEDPRIFVNYTTDADEAGFVLETIVSSFEVSSNPNVVDMASEHVLISFGQPQENHNGGMLAFGKDNCLYVGAGDGGNGNDTGPGHSPGGNGQDLSKPLGKILRIDQDDPSVRAPGNPTEPEYEHIWDYGVRNPWRFSFDRDTGDMYIGDVGQDEIEEVSIAPRGVGNNNFGWPIMEGASCFGGGGCDMNGLVLPAYDYPHAADSENCIIGGYVYRGSAIPSLHGWYLYGDSGTGRRIRAFVWDGEAACDTAVPLSERDGLTLNARITSFGEDAAGELYVTTAAGLYRIDQAE